jgi:2-keto-myo-inositol isomerase
MKTCFNTITCGQERPLKATIDLAGKYGFEGIEIEAGRLDDYLTRHTINDLKGQLEHYRLTVAAIMAFPFFAFDLTRQHEQVARVAHYAQLAQQIDSEILLCFTADSPPASMGIAEAIELAGRAAQRYGEASGQFGIKCALEPIGGAGFMPGPRQALATVGASTTAFVGIMMDTFHYYKSGIPLEEVRRIPPGQLLIVHVNDVPDLPREQLTDSHRLYPGHGVLPLVETFRILKDELHYEGYLSIEIFNPLYWADEHESVIRHAKEAIDRILTQCAGS